jgi:hypothetical protein
MSGSFSDPYGDDPITSQTGLIDSSFDGDNLDGTTSIPITIASGVTITTTENDPWTVTAGTTVTVNGSLNLVGTDQLKKGHLASAGHAAVADAKLVIGATGTVEIGNGFSVADYGQLAYGAAGGTILVDFGQPLSVLAGIANIQIGDTIALSGVDVANYSITASGAGENVNLYNAQGGNIGAFSLQGLDPSIHSFALKVVDGVSFLTMSGAPPCFMAGTRIRTMKGEIPVERLKAGDLIVIADGSAKPLRWLGRSTVSMEGADPLVVLPIRIRAGALGPNTPRRDLLVSPDHAMFLDGLLVQAGALVNSRSILRESNVPARFVYYHVELDAHALIVAEGALTESFVDNADRMNFDNWDEHQALGTAEPIVEMEFSRAKAARQIPLSLRKTLDSRAVDASPQTEASTRPAAADQPLGSAARSISPSAQGGAERHPG